MTSLTEVYRGNAREVSNLRRLYAGVALVIAGAALGVLGVLVATTDLFAGVVSDEYGAVRLAGALAGLGVPAALVGVFAVLPAGRRVRAAAAIGATLCVLGVALYWHAYPSHWRGHGDQLTLEVSVVYLLGLFTSVWCLFTAVATFKTRNDPGGALEMNVVRRGRTKVVEVDRGGLGGIGLFGGRPDGEPETQTNDAPKAAGSTESAAATAGGRSTTATGGPAAAAPASDGGSTATDIGSPLGGGASGGRDAEIVDASEPTEPADRYCGNCEHFEYVRSNSGMVPYCGRHEDRMDDMDACEEWTPNRR